VTAYEASVQRIFSSVRQFLIHSAFVLVRSLIVHRCMNKLQVFWGVFCGTMDVGSKYALMIVSRLLTTNYLLYSQIIMNSGRLCLRKPALGLRSFCLFLVLNDVIIFVIKDMTCCRVFWYTRYIVIGVFDLVSFFMCLRYLRSKAAAAA